MAALVGKRIREIREALGLTQEKLAFEIDMSKGHVSKLERGLQEPGVGTLQRVAERLGVEAWDLLIDPQRTARERLIEASRGASASSVAAATRVLLTAAAAEIETSPTARASRRSRHGLAPRRGGVA